MDDNKTTEERRGLCESCGNYNKPGRPGCALLRPCCRETPWENPYCPVSNWFPEGRFGPPPDKVAEPGGDVPPAAMDSYKSLLKGQGVGFREEGGRIVITHVPQAEVEALRFFQEDKPFNVPGTDHLRRQYFDELARLSAEEGGCTDCAKGKLMRKYLPAIRQALSVHAQAARTTALPNGTKQAS